MCSNIMDLEIIALRKEQEQGREGTLKGGGKEERKRKRRSPSVSLPFPCESVSCSVTLCNPTENSLPGSSAMGFSRQEYWSGSRTLLQGIFPTQGLSPGLLHCRQSLYHLSYGEDTLFSIYPSKSLCA